MISAYKFVECAYHDDVHMYGYYETNVIFIPSSNIAHLITFDESQIANQRCRGNEPTVVGLAIGFRDNGTQVNVNAVKIPKIKNTAIHERHISHFKKNVEEISLPIDYVTQCIATYNAIIASKYMMASLKSVALPKTNAELANDIWLQQKSFDNRQNYTRNELANFQQAMQNAITLYPNNVFYHERLLQIICHKDGDKSMVDVQQIANILQTILDFHYGCYDNLLDALGNNQDSPIIIEIFRKHMLNEYKIMVECDTYDMKDYCNTHRFVFKPRTEDMQR